MNTFSMRQISKENNSNFNNSVVTRLYVINANERYEQSSIFETRQVFSNNRNCIITLVIMENTWRYRCIFVVYKRKVNTWVILFQYPSPSFRNRFLVWEKLRGINLVVSFSFFQWAISNSLIADFLIQSILFYHSHFEITLWWLFRSLDKDARQLASRNYIVDLPISRIQRAGTIGLD